MTKRLRCRSRRRGDRIGKLLLAAGIATLAVLLVPASGIASTPGLINFQGLLLDSGGQPVNGDVDLVFTLYSALTTGSPLWSESHDDVAVQDGVYDVALGSTTPITPAVLETGSVYLEIAVDGETLTPRQRLLAVPYAIRSQTSESAEAVDALPSTFVTALFEQVEFDGGAPPNTDPSEGVDDPDGDGLANFLDPDNDEDTISDVDELGQGSDINLVTPILTGTDPTWGDTLATTTVTVSGQNFLPGLSVVVGSETPAPTNLSPTSFEIQVGPQPVGTVPVVVTLANGESVSGSFDFLPMRRVFITSQPSTGALGGVAGANATCASLATAAGRTGTFLAWIADSAESPDSRFTKNPGPYVLYDDTVVAMSYADLTGGAVLASIDITETGAQATTFTNAWTSVAPDGTRLGSVDCTEWSSADGGLFGSTGLGGGGTSSCVLFNRLYCFEQ